MAGVVLSARDIINEALHMAGEVTDTGISASEYRPKALEYLNRIHLAVLSGSNEFDLDLAEPFSWAKAVDPGVITLQVSVTGSASVTSGSVSGSFSVAPTLSLAGRYIRFDSQSDIFRITAHTASQTAFTMDSEFTGTTGSFGYSAYKLDYDTVTNVLRLIAPMRVNKGYGAMFTQNLDNPGQIFGIDLAAMRREYPMAAMLLAVPNRFAVKSYDPSTKVFTAQFNSTVPELTRVEYDYIPYPTELYDTDISYPVVPVQHRIVLSYGVAHLLCVDKNDDRGDHYLAKTQSGLKSLSKAEQEQRIDINPYKGQIVPRRGQVSKYRWWWRS